MALSRRELNVQSAAAQLPVRGSDENQQHGHRARIENGGPRKAINAVNGSALKKTPSVAVAIAHTTLPPWLNIGLMVGLIFGGCCSNVFALESIVKDEPSSGLIITFLQFALTTLLTLPSFISPATPETLFLKRPSIPFGRLLKYIGLFFSVNALNNFAFSCKISVPVHIILRSGGSITTVLVGWLAGKRYSNRQVLGVAILTFGVILAALSDAQAKGKISSPVEDEEQGLQTTTSFAFGLFILLVAQTLSAVMGVYTENTYARYGKHWRDTLFFSHLLSLPLFLPFFSPMTSQFRVLASSPPLSSSMSSTFWLFSFASGVPTQICMLVLNALTQYACIRGVNMLAATTSSLGVTIVLNIRKLVSLLLSIWIFNNKLAPGVLIGAAFVFGGGSVYASGNSKRKSKEDKKTK